MRFSPCTVLPWLCILFPCCVGFSHGECQGAPSKGTALGCSGFFGAQHAPEFFLRGFYGKDVLCDHADLLR